MCNIQDTLKLARAFGEQIQTELTTRQFREAVYLNNCDGVDSPICHTHDFCDANMSMHAAFLDTFGRNPLDGPDGGMTEADTKLWNDAWAVAKAADFFA